MKNIKKLLSIVMVLAMVLSLGVQAFATNVKLPDDAAGHTMVAYQIFKGEQLEPGDNGQLGVTDWADGYDENTLLDALIANYSDAGFKRDMTAVEAAKAISELSATFKTDAERVAFAQVVADALKAAKAPGTTINGSADLANGYWVIVDETPEASLPMGDNGQPETRSTVLLEVVGAALTLQDKIDKPTFEKKVNNMDADVAGLNDTVTFTLTATLPGNYHDFQNFSLAFEDNMDSGLTFNDDIKVYYLDAEGARHDITEYFKTLWQFNVGTKQQTHFTTTCDDTKTISALGDKSTIVLEYTATVNENAVVREYNEARIVYSRDPNVAGGGEPEPGPWDKVTVINVKIDGDKVEPDPDGGEGATKPLEGAGFVLLKEVESDSTATKVTWETLGEHKKGDKVNYNGKTYVLWDDEQFSDEKGDFGFDQLGAGKYVLAETTVPAGYNRADDVEFEVKKTLDKDNNVTGAQCFRNGVEVSAIEVKAGEPENSVEGIFDEDVINKQGLELPETGGMGTTIFYVVGAILVVGAVILLVTRKRVNGASK